MKVIKALKLVNRIDLEDIPKVIKESYSSNSKSNNNSNENGNNQSVSINKVIDYNIKDRKELSKACIENKHIKVVKSKKMTPIIRKL